MLLPTICAIIGISAYQYGIVERMTGAFSFLSTLLERLFPDRSTAQFLKERNARVTVQEMSAHSFYTVKAMPLTSISAGGHKFLLRIKVLPAQKIRVSVYSVSAGQTLADVTVPYEQKSGAMNLNLDDLHLKIEIDDDPTVGKA